MRSLWFGRTKLLKPGKDSRDYLRVVLSKDGERKQFKVHRLVAKAFIPNPLDLPFINHVDENPSNNQVSNLEWCDAKYNTNYGTCQKRRAAKKSKPVLQFDKAGNLIRKWPSAIEIEKQLGFHQSAICQCCNGKLKFAYKFSWKYEKENP